MKKRFILENLGCANCASKMEEAIGKLDGVKSASVNFFTTKMIIEGEDEKFPAIVEQAKMIINKLESQVVVKKA